MKYLGLEFHWNWAIGFITKANWLQTKNLKITHLLLTLYKIIKETSWARKIHFDMSDDLIFKNRPIKFQNNRTIFCPPQHILWSFPKRLFSKMNGHKPRLVKATHMLIFSRYLETHFSWLVGTHTSGKFESRTKFSKQWSSDFHPIM